MIIGAVDEKIQALVIPGVKKQAFAIDERVHMFFQILFARDCGPGRLGFAVPVQYVITKLVPRQSPTVPPDPGGQTVSGELDDY